MQIKTVYFYNNFGEKMTYIYSSENKSAFELIDDAESHVVLGESASSDEYIARAQCSMDMGDKIVTYRRCYDKSGSIIESSIHTLYKR